MTDKPGEAALHYHETTKHTSVSVRSTAHFLDWDNQPVPFKIYHEVKSSRLPPAAEPTGMSTLDALDPAPAPSRSVALAPSDLSRVLFHAAGITKRLRRPGGGEMLFRAAACTGALYHIDIYVVSEAGVLHYDPSEHALDHLRDGDWRSVLIEATGNEEHIAAAEAVLILTTTYWRNAWKYRSRAYRHAFWDGGTILANLLAMARALELSAHVELGFADGDIEQLLDIDPEREGVVALVSLGNQATPPPPSPGTPSPLGLQTLRLSAREVPYPAIHELHRASSLNNGAEARAWREGPDIAKRRSVDRSHADYQLEEPLESVIRRRGSARAFEREPIEVRALAQILNEAIPEAMLTELYVIANAVEGLEPGAYVHEDAGLKSLKKGDFRQEARFLALEQSLAGDAAANVYVLVDLERVVARYGDRGYRIAQLEGGILGGRIYLQAIEADTCSTSNVVAIQ